MAKLLTLAPTAYRNIERGKTEITVIKIYQIATYLNINLLQLLDHENSLSILNDGKADTSLMMETLKHYKDEISFLRRQLELLATTDSTPLNRLKPA